MRTMKRSIGRVVPAAVLACLAGVGHAHNGVVAAPPPPPPIKVYVPRDFPTIQAAVDAAQTHEVILVNAMDVPQNVVVDGKNDLAIQGYVGFYPYGSTLTGAPGGAVIEVCNSTNVTISDLDLRGGSGGIAVHDSSVQVKSVWISYAQGDGILADGASTIGLDTVFVTSVSGDGVRLVGAAATVTRARIALAGGDGISATDAGDISIFSSEIYVPGGSGVRIDGAGLVRVEGAYVAGACFDDRFTNPVDGAVLGPTTGRARGDGINVRADSVEMWNSQVGVFGGRGIVARGSTSLDECAVLDVGAEGIVVQGAIDVSSSSVERSAGDGLVCEGAATSIVGNTIDQAGGCGIRVAPGAPAADAWHPGEIRENEVRRTAADGIVVACDGLSVTQNTIEGAGGAGIVVTSAGVQVTTNEIDYPVTDGVALHGSRRARVDGNHVLGAGGCGFRLDAAAARNVLTRNVSESCTQWGMWEGDDVGRNQYAKSNRFGKSHRGRRHRG